MITTSTEMPPLLKALYIRKASELAKTAEGMGREDVAHYLRFHLGDVLTDVVTARAELKRARDAIMAQFLWDTDPERDAEEAEDMV